MSGLLAMLVSGALWMSQAADRPSISAAELKALRETNIFSPYRSKSYERPRKEERREERKSEPAPEKPKPPVVTGIIFDLKAGIHQAVVEDRNSDRLKIFRDPRFLKAGDELAGIKIQEVTAEKVVILHGETEKPLKVGESFPDTGAKPSGEAAPSVTTTAPVETKPLDEGAKTDVLRLLRERNKKKDRPSNEP